MGNSTIVTNTDPSVDASFPKVTGTTVGAKHALDVATLSGVINFGWDYMTLTQATLTDTYLFKLGGSGGTTQGTIVITFTDSGKGTIATVAKT